MTHGDRLRVFVAGHPTAPLTHATLAALEADPRVEVVGWTGEPIDAAAIRATRPDVLISAAHAHIIGSEVLTVPRLGALGLHPSRLPAYRGSYPLWWALRAGERSVGLTLYRLTPRLDDGPVIDQVEVAVEPDDTFATLYERVSGQVDPVVRRLVDVVHADGALPNGTDQGPGPFRVYRTPPQLVRALFRAFWAGRRVARRIAGHLRRRTPR